MITFVLSLIALVAGYLIYGRIVERIFAPDDRPTLRSAWRTGSITWYFPDGRFL